jgi:hypothetical protein
MTTLVARIALKHGNSLVILKFFIDFSNEHFILFISTLKVSGMVNKKFILFNSSSSYILNIRP